ncbi:MAG: ATP-dependent helicase [Desulfobulbaceae bacterium]|nr:ATP-dependent helicase [Desulfobulbaceae bacterium]
MIASDDWQAADGLTLEPNALLAAKEQLGSLALTAGPGAGKTEMLAQRADFLLRTGFCRYPKRILAISFKVDAARNLKERVRRRCGPLMSARFDSYTFHAFAKRIIDRFRPVLTGQDALDVDYTIGDRRVSRRQITFTDLVPLAKDILETSIVARNAVRQTYSDVFLDEFQDCTNQQYSLIKSAFLGTKIRLTAVGDTKQKIMTWAGALEGIFANFAEDFSATPLNLYRNFRSQPQLLRMQNEIIRVLDPGSVMPEELIEGDAGIIEVQHYDTSEQEAQSLADLIERWLVDEEIPSSEIAVLVSKQAEHYAELLMAELKNRDIPFRNEQQLQDLSSEPATRLIADYLLVLFGSREPDAYLRLMERLTDNAIDEGEQSRIRNSWQLFLKVEKMEVKQSCIDDDFSTKWPYVINFLNKFGRSNLVALSADYESFSRLKEVVKETKQRLIELMNNDSDLIKALSHFSDDRAVRIMTIHKSKGLEFDSVIILGVEEETFWSDPDEERCAFFVGVSRAKKRLVLTYAKNRSTPTANPRRWSQTRTPHEEFLGYANPFANISK